jgi:hypothetical protein
MTQYQWALWEILRGIENDASVKILNGCEHLSKIVDVVPVSDADIALAVEIMPLISRSMVKPIRDDYRETRS